MWYRGIAKRTPKDRDDLCYPIILLNTVSVSVTFECRSPLGVPVVSGEVGHGYPRIVFTSSFLSSLFSHNDLYQQSPT